MCIVKLLFDGLKLIWNLYLLKDDSGFLFFLFNGLFFLIKIIIVMNFLSVVEIGGDYLFNKCLESIFLIEVYWFEEFEYDF